MNQIQIRRRTRRRLTVNTVVGAAILIFYIVIKGDPESQLHRDALEYCFYLIFGTLAAYGGMAGWDKKVDASKDRTSEET